MPSSRTDARGAAEALALRGLGFLAADPDRLAAFLADAGVGPETFREAVREPGFLTSVLDHILAADARLTAFAAAERFAPDHVWHARRLLGRPSLDLQ